MTTEELIELFEKDEHFLKFHEVKPQRSTRPDLHAFLLLDELVPGTSDIVGCAEHDIIWLDADLDELAKVITEEQVIELRRCGVLYDTESLAMFV